MATQISRHPTSYATTKGTLPVTVPTQKPTYSHPLSSRVAASPFEFSDSDTSSGGSRMSAGSYAPRSSYTPSHHSGSDYDSYHSQCGLDVSDMLSDRMNSAFDPMRMDRSLVDQAKT